MGICSRSCIHSDSRGVYAVMDTGIKMIDPNGKVRKIRVIPSNGLGSEAYVKTGLFKRISNCAASNQGAIENLVSRLLREGWKQI